MISTKIKNLLISSFVLLFGLIIVFISTVRVCQSQNQVEESVLEATAEGKQVDVINTKVVEKVDELDYYLPYPRILPDHPLYWLKMIRDRILLTFARDPQVKLERLLLYADKRLGAAKVLIEGGKIQLGVTTATKAEKYLEQATFQLKNLKNSGQLSSDFITKLSLAAVKHEEILEKLVDKASDQTKPEIEKAIEKTKQSYNFLIEMGAQDIKKEKSEEQSQKIKEDQPESGISSFAKCQTNDDCYVDNECLPNHCLGKSGPQPMLCINKQQITELIKDKDYNCDCLDNKCQWHK